jgi:hypothetical protein
MSAPNARPSTGGSTSTRSVDVGIEQQHDVCFVETASEYLRQPSGQAYDADPDDWMLWSITYDDDDAASGFSNALTVRPKVKSVPQFQLMFCCRIRLIGGTQQESLTVVIPTTTEL